MRLVGYSLRRLALMPLQILVVLLFTFVLSRTANQSPVYQVLGPYASPAAVKHMSHALGLDQPIYVQFARYIQHLARGDMGVSIVTGRPVLSDILDRLPATLELITISLVFAIVIGVSLGVITVMSKRRVTNSATTAYGMLAGSFPDFIVGLGLVYLFFVVLGWAPAPLGQLDPALTPPARITGSIVIDSILGGNWRALGSAIAHLALPVATMVIVYTPGILKIVRSTVRELQNSEMLTVARAFGLPRRLLMWYVLRNALPPIVTTIGITYGYLLGADVLVERVFSWNGVGLYSVQAITSADFAGLQAFVLFATLFSLLVYLLVDIINALADPRVRY